MDIKVIEENGAKIVNINGRLDTVTSPELEKIASPLVEVGKVIIFDCEKMEYISSAGLRVILSTHKQCIAAGGRFVVRNLTAEVKSVFDMTGFSRILNIES
jgi:anti-anti-sigma factor